MFKSGMPIYGKQFIDRKEHLQRFKTFLDHGQHIMIKAPRRYGKTSLVLHLFSTYQYNHIYIDIKRFSSLNELSEYIINETYKYAGITGIIARAKESISQLFKSIRTETKIDIGIAELTIEMIEKQQKQEVSELDFFLYAIDLIENIAKQKNIQIKCAFDEFQDILMLSNQSILDKLRSVMQQHQHVTYLFLGSIESIMTEIFSNKSSPFFHFSRIIELDGLNTTEVYNFCQDFFEQQHLSYDPFLYELIHYLDGHPYYTMKTLQSLYYQALEKQNTHLSKTDCINALTTAFFETKSYLEEAIETIKQKKHHHITLHELANNEQNSDLSSDIRYKTYRSLEQMGHVKRIARGQYEFTDIFMKILLQQRQGGFLLEDNLIFPNLTH